MDARLQPADPGSEHVVHIAAEAARIMRPHRGRRHASRVIADGAGYCTIQTVRAAQTARGYLAVRSQAALSASDRLLVAHALSPISIELEKPAKVSADTRAAMWLAIKARELLDVSAHRSR